MSQPGTASRACLAVTLLGLGLFASGVFHRPAGDDWALAYDLVLYNTVSLAAAGVCLPTARRLPPERMAWLALATALLLSALGDVTYTLVIAQLPEEPFPSLADAFWLAYYPFALHRTRQPDPVRVPRFHASMWLDGVIGALGATAVAVAFLLGPSLELTEGDPAAMITNLAYPVADVLLLALLVAVGAILGVRRDPTLLVLGLGLSFNLVGDVLYLNLTAQGLYAAGGPLDLTWLAAITLMGLAAHNSVATADRSCRRPARDTRRMAGAGGPPDLQRRQPRRPRPGVGRAHLRCRRMVRHRLRDRRAGPHRRHLPRGPGLQRGPGAGPHRRVDRPGQP